MSKRDYTLLAKVIRCERTTVSQEGELMRALLAKGIARELKRESATFDRERFLKACEVTP